MRIFSKVSTAVAFDGGAEAKDRGLNVRVEIRPGVNDITNPDAMKVLDFDPAFEKAVVAGHLVVSEIPADEPKVEEAPPLKGAPVVADPRARKPGEADKAYNARMKKLDDAEAAALAADKPRVDFLATFNGLSADEQAATYPTLQDNEKEWVDADRKSKQGAE